ncbi:MAG: nitronate monooxygenase [Pseudomonadota bacterium]
MDRRTLVERLAKGRMRLPLIVAPMFLVSGPELVAAASAAGVSASFPFPNARTLETLDGWLEATCATQGDDHPPFAANMLTHRSYDRLADELDLVAKHRPEIVITALGGPAPVIETVQGYGGAVFADVNDLKFARKAADAGADGLVLVSSGAGGHTGSMSAFAFVSAVREFFDGVVVLAGGVSDGRALRAAEALGADFAYMGTRFIAASESLATDDYREMVVAAEFSDLVRSNKLTGAEAYYLRASLERMGIDPDAPDGAGRPDFSQSQQQIKAWRDVWSAGHGVGSVSAVEPASAIVARVAAEYAEAVSTPPFAGAAF